MTNLLSLPPATTKSAPPELPEPVIAREECAISSDAYYTANQMREYGELCRKDGLEAAAQAREQVGLKLDAARYRWLAKNLAKGNFDVLESAFAVLARVDSCTKNDLDAAIDAGMKGGVK